jgi:hypothetical protein
MGYKPASTNSTWVSPEIGENNRNFWQFQLMGENKV